jgi:transcriptional regulator with XRE-family HTH domain
MTLMKRLRLERGISQQVLGVKAKIQSADISRIERRVLVPSAGQLGRIARALKVEASELLLRWKPMSLPAQRWQAQSNDPGFRVSEVPVPRKKTEWTVVHRYAAQTDIARCARGLLRVLLWEPPPAPAGAGEDPRASSGPAQDQEEARVRTMRPSPQGSEDQ